MKSLSIKFSPEGQPIVVTKPTEDEVREQLTGRHVREPNEEELHELERQMNNTLRRSATTTREIGRVLRKRGPLHT